MALVYCYPLDDPKTFDSCAIRWAHTRRQFDPGHEHDLHVCFCNGTPTDIRRNVFRDWDFSEHIYNGKGWDIGAYQFMSRKLSYYPFVVFMNARVHFWKSGWLKRFMTARETNYDPNGLYGISASYEWCYLGQPPLKGPAPHIRTACFGTNPQTLNRYPYRIESRESGFRFESGMWNFSRWYEDMGYRVLMVTWDGVYPKRHWRTPPNIFRRGDQSNVLVCDRHTDIYKKASRHEREKLERAANGILPEQA